jgi:hypothetical protein
MVFEDLTTHNYNGCINRLDENILIVNTNHLLTFNEFWIISLICNKYVSNEKYQLLNSYQRFNPMYQDTLSTFLSSIVKEQKKALNERIDSLYKKNEELALKKLYFKLLSADNQDLIDSFKYEKSRVIKQINHNESEYSNSSHNQIDQIKIKNYIDGFSFENMYYLGKSNSIFVWDNALELPFLKLGLVTNRRRFGFLASEYSFDFNLTERYKEIYPINNGGYYYLTYQEHPNLKMRLGYSYSLGVNVYGNLKFDTSILPVLSGTHFSWTEGLVSVGGKLCALI